MITAKNKYLRRSIKHDKPPPVGLGRVTQTRRDDTHVVGVCDRSQPLERWDGSITRANRKVGFWFRTSATLASSLCTQSNTSAQGTKQHVVGRYPYPSSKMPEWRKDWFLFLSPARREALAACHGWKKRQAASSGPAQGPKRFSHWIFTLCFVGPSLPERICQGFRTPKRQTSHPKSRPAPLPGSFARQSLATTPTQCNADGLQRN